MILTNCHAWQYNNTSRAAFCDPCRGRMRMNRCEPGVFGRVAASTSGYMLISLRDDESKQESNLFNSVAVLRPNAEFWDSGW